MTRVWGPGPPNPHQPFGYGRDNARLSPELDRRLPRISSIHLSLLWQ